MTVIIEKFIAASKNKAVAFSDDDASTLLNTITLNDPNITWYTILQLSHDATHDQIKSAYRTLALLHHPDKGGNPNIFKIIASAYETLSDPKKRRSYNQKIGKLIKDNYFEKFNAIGLNTGQYKLLQKIHDKFQSKTLIDLHLSFLTFLIQDEKLSILNAIAQLDDLDESQVKELHAFYTIGLRNAHFKEFNFISAHFKAMHLYHETDRCFFSIAIILKIFAQIKLDQVVASSEHICTLSKNERNLFVELLCDDHLTYQDTKNFHACSPSLDTASEKSLSTLAAKTKNLDRLLMLTKHSLSDDGVFKAILENEIVNHTNKILVISLLEQDELKKLYENILLEIVPKTKNCDLLVKILLYKKSTLDVRDAAKNRLMSVNGKAATDNLVANLFITPEVMPAKFNFSLLEDKLYLLKDLLYSVDSNLFNSFISTEKSDEMLHVFADHPNSTIETFMVVANNEFSSATTLQRLVSRRFLTPELLHAVLVNENVYDNSGNILIHLKNTTSLDFIKKYILLAITKIEFEFIAKNIFVKNKTGHIVKDFHGLLSLNPKTPAPFLLDIAALSTDPKIIENILNHKKLTHEIIETLLDRHQKNKIPANKNDFILLKLSLLQQLKNYTDDPIHKKNPPRDVQDLLSARALMFSIAHQELYDHIATVLQPISSQPAKKSGFSLFSAQSKYHLCIKNLNAEMTRLDPTTLKYS